MHIRKRPNASGSSILNASKLKCPTLRRVGHLSICEMKYSCYVPFMQGRDKLNSLSGQPMRLTPGMASLRLLVLRFVREYLGSWGASPSYGEIAAALDTNRTRVRKAVQSLAADGLLWRSPGPRGLALPEDLSGAMRLLTSHGYRVEAVTHSPLPADAVLDYDPCGSVGVTSGEEEGVERGRSKGRRGSQLAAQQLGKAPSSARRRGTAAAA